MAKKRTWRSSAVRPFRPRPRALETLEDRRLLSLTPELVADIDTDGGNSVALGFTTFGDWVYFRGKSDSFGWAIWRTQGVAGDVEQVVPSFATPDRSVSSLTLAGDRLYFFMNDGIHGCELWVIDAPGEPPRLVRDINPGNEGMYFGARTAVGDKLFFVAAILGRQDELWVTDGTSDGTTKLTDFAAGSSSVSFDSYPIMGAIGDDLAFVVVRDRRQEVWKSDGTAEGTQLVIQLGSNPYPAGNASAAANGMLFFVASDPEHGSNPWRTDGTPEGTIMLSDVIPRTDSGTIDRFKAWGDQVVFQAYTPTYGFEPWISDGTPEGTRLLVDTKPGIDWGRPDEFTPIGDNLYFTAVHNQFGRELWRYNRVTATAVVVKDIWPGIRQAIPRSLVALGETLYFLANDGVHGEELWKSDGTEEETEMFFEGRPGAADGAYFTIYAAGNHLYFRLVATDWSDEPWVSDGTTQGTYQLVDLRGGNADSDPHGLTLMGDFVYFVANARTGSGTGIWRTPLGGQGAELVARGNRFDSPPKDLVVFGNRLYFIAEPSQGGAALWSSDGTSAGTVIVKHIPAAITDTSQARLIVLGDRLVFFCGYGSQLWTSDGTPDGTDLLQDFGIFGSYTLAPALLGGVLYFWVWQSGGTSVLWKTDGTTEGTAAVSDAMLIRSAAGAFGHELVSDGERLYFNSAASTELGQEPWVSDGTPEGTRLLADINPGGPDESDSAPRWFTYAGRFVYFVAFRPALGYELWRTDGTEEGTVLVADVNPGVASSQPHNLTAVGDELYFVANDGVVGNELWVANSSGARLVQDIRPGAQGSNPHTILPVRGGAMFFADDGETGHEPWRLTHDGAARIADLFPGKTLSLAPQSESNPLANVSRVMGRHVYFQGANDIVGNELWYITIPVGDTNFDGEINLEDLNNVRNHFGGTGLGDADGDGDVDLDDLNLVRNNFGGPGEAPGALVRGGAWGSRRAAMGEAKSWERAVDLLFTSDRFAAGELVSLVGTRKLRKLSRV